jgi:hypothetical protein
MAWYNTAVSRDARRADRRDFFSRNAKPLAGLRRPTMLATNILEQVLNQGVVWILVPLAGIVVGGVIAVSSMIIKHRERMAKIGMGIDPDAQASQPQQRDPQMSDSTPRF